MPHTLPQGVEHDAPLPVVHRIGFTQPLRWLAAGWRDLVASPVASIAYGLLFAIAGDLILLQVFSQPHLFLLAVSGFFLVAPLLAAGLYEISRRHERGQPASFVDSLAGWRRNGRTMALFGFMLAFVVLVWGRISGILFGLVYSTDLAPTSVAAFVQELIRSGQHTEVILAWLFAGGTLALLVFGCAAVAVPYLLDRAPDRGRDLVSATLTSLRAVSLNLGAMMLWGSLIVVLALIGFASFLFGLIVLMPLLGHASWHAYRDLVEPPN
jgi:uncharacterized membrane protein